VFPFNLAGPPFLWFYGVFGSLLLLAYRYYLGRLGPARPLPVLSQLTGDPYAIAYLRSGRDETVKLALVNLIDRGLLAVSGKTLQGSAKADGDALRRPLDRAILSRCTTLTTVGEALHDGRVRAACDDYDRELRERGLLRSAGEQRRALTGAIAVVALLAGISTARVLQALSHDRHNVLFLIFLTVVGCVAAVQICARTRTRLGRSALTDLRTLLRRLRERINRLAAGGATNEAVLFAAVFGIEALPAQAFPYLRTLFPRSGGTASGGDSGSDSGGDGGGCGSGCGGCGGD